MKRIILILTTFLFILAGMISCQKSQEQESDCYMGICLQQRKDKIFLKFVPNANIEQLRNIISIDKSLQPMSGTNLDELHIYGFIVLETKYRGQIPLASIESFKAREDVISVTYLYQYKEYFQGLTGEFIVKLKRTTSFEQLQRLAEQNNCKILEEERFSSDYKLTVSKFFTLNAMQAANLFYETELFEYSVPNFIILNTFQ